jgi:hypothetical protein
MAKERNRAVRMMAKKSESRRTRYRITSVPIVATIRTHTARMDTIRRARGNHAGKPSASSSGPPDSMAPPYRLVE